MPALKKSDPKVGKFFPTKNPFSKKHWGCQDISLSGGQIYDKFLICYIIHNSNSPEFGAASLKAGLCHQGHLGTWLWFRCFGFLRQHVIKTVKIY